MRVAFGILVVLLAIPTHADARDIAQNQAQDIFHADPPTLFRDYALSACLGQAFPQISPETSAAASGYVQYGDGPYDAYTKADALAHAFLQRRYPSQTGANMSVMKCLDFMHSQEVAALITRYFPSGPDKQK